MVGLEAELVTSLLRHFVSSVKSVVRKCSVAVWRAESANFSFTHSDIVPADVHEGKKKFGRRIDFILMNDTEIHAESQQD